MAVCIVEFDEDGNIFHIQRCPVKTITPITTIAVPMKEGKIPHKNNKGEITTATGKKILPPRSIPEDLFLELHAKGHDKFIWNQKTDKPEVHPDYKNLASQLELQSLSSLNETDTLPIKPKTTGFSFIDTLEHYCVAEAKINVHKENDFQVCDACNLQISESVAKAASLPTAGANCPKCSKTMVLQKGNKFGELHFHLCVDKYKHYPEWLRTKKIDQAEFDNWVSQLTEEEKRGYYYRSDNHHMVATLEESELNLLNTSPNDFSTLITSKIHAKIEHGLQHQVQRKYNTEEKPSTRLMKHIKK